MQFIIFQGGEVQGFGQNPALPPLEFNANKEIGTQTLKLRFKRPPNDFRTRFQGTTQLHTAALGLLEAIELAQKQPRAAESLSRLILRPPLQTLSVRWALTDTAKSSRELIGGDPVRPDPSSPVPVRPAHFALVPVRPGPNSLRSKLAPISLRPGSSSPRSQFAPVPIRPGQALGVKVQSLQIQVFALGFRL